MPGNPSVVCVLPLGSPPLLIQLPSHCSEAMRITTVPVPVAYGRMTPPVADAVSHLAGLAQPGAKRAADGSNDAVAEAVLWAAQPDASHAPLDEQVRRVAPAFTAYPPDSKLRRLPATDMHVCSAASWGAAMPYEPIGSAALFVGTSSGYVHRVLVHVPPPCTHPPDLAGRKRPREEASQPQAAELQLTRCARMPSLSSVSTLQWASQFGGLLLVHSAETHVDLLDPETLAIRQSLMDFDRPSQHVRSNMCMTLRRGMVQLHREQPLVVAANAAIRAGHTFAAFDTRGAKQGSDTGQVPPAPRLAVGSLPDEPPPCSVEWHPHAPVLLVPSSSDTLHAWVLATDADWNAFSPHFPELGLNVEYVEKEDEFDAVSEQQAAATAAALQGVAGSSLPDQAKDDMDKYGLTAKAAAAAFHVAPSVAKRIAAGLLPSGLGSAPPPSHSAGGASTQFGHDSSSGAQTEPSQAQQPARSVFEDEASTPANVDVVGGLLCSPSAAASQLQQTQPQMTLYRHNPDESFARATVPLRMLPTGAPDVAPGANAGAPAASAAAPGAVEAASPVSPESQAQVLGTTSAEAWIKAGSTVEGVQAALATALHQEGLMQMTAVGRARLGNAGLYDASGGYFAAAPSAAAQQQ